MSKKLEALPVQIDGKTVQVAQTGLKLGSRGTVKPPAQFMIEHVPSKGLRRAIRRGLDQLGRRDLSHASVVKN